MTQIEPDLLGSPQGYQLSGDLFGDFDSMPPWRWLLIGNLWALIPLAVAVLILWLPYQFYAALGAPLALFPDPQWSTLAFWGLGALIIPDRWRCRGAARTGACRAGLPREI